MGLMDLDQADGWFRSGNRQIVKSTVIADWQQKAGSWSAQRGGVGKDVGRGSKEVRNSRSRVSPARFSVTGTARFKGLHHWMRVLHSARSEPCFFAPPLRHRPRAIHALSSSLPLCPYIRFSIGSAFIDFDGSSRTPHSTRLGTSVHSMTRK